MKKKLIICAIAVLLTMMITGCANNMNVATERTMETVTDNSDTEEMQTADPQQTTDAEEADEHLKSMVGEYELLAIYNDDFTSFTADEYATGDLSVYFEDGKYKADYMYYAPDYMEEHFGMTLNAGSGEFFKDKVKSDWYYTLKRRGDESQTYSLSSIEPGTVTMQLCSTYEYEGEEGEIITDYDNRYFLFVSDACANKEQIEYKLRYPEKITVSNVAELYRAIGSGKHIILKEGTYNISELTKADIETNESINYDYYDGEPHRTYGESIYIPDMRNIIIEGEEGANVLICTEDYSVAPLEFKYCDHITLKNLTLGHEVEPGYCSGSVVCMTACRNMKVEKCSLYGSGTYGIETYDSDFVCVNDTDIYECTYGGVNLLRSSNFEFNNCKIRDSKEFSIIDLTGCWNMKFNNCEITGNYTNDNWALINTMDSGEITFDGCTIQDNEYAAFIVGNLANFDNCDIQESSINADVEYFD